MDVMLYRQVVKDLCQSVGLEQWEEVAVSGHLLVDDCVVGLIHDERDAQSGELSVFVEMPARFGVSDSDSRLHLELLRANVHRPAGMRGHFGMHAETGSPVYCLRTEVGPQTRGADLADLLASQVRVAADILESIDN